jgi:cyanophycin synthetase
VLNAEDELVADFAELCDGKVIFFAVDRSNPIISAHLANDERGVFVADGRITLATGSDEIRLCRLGDVPLIGKTKKPEDIANVLAAVAAGWALGLTQEVIVTGLKTCGIEAPDPAALLLLAQKKSAPLKAAATRK